MMLWMIDAFFSLEEVNFIIDKDIIALGYSHFGVLCYNGSEMEPYWRCRMPNITVKNIPEDLYQQLKELAKANRRSINREIIVCIEQVVSSRRLDPAKVLGEARRLREKTSHYTISDEELSQAKISGRP